MSRARATAVWPKSCKSTAEGRIYVAACLRTAYPNRRQPGVMIVRSPHRGLWASLSYQPDPSSIHLHGTVVEGIEYLRCFLEGHLSIISYVHLY